MRRRDQIVVLEAREIERLVPDDRTTGVEAALLLIEGGDLVREEVLRVAELVVAEISEPGAAEPVAPRLGDRVDDGAIHAPVFRVVPVGQHFELFDVLLAVALVRSAAVLVGHVHAVHLVLGHVAAGRADLNGARIAARAGDERHEVEPVAAVERKVLDLFLLDAPRELRLLGVHERRFARHRYVFRNGRQLQREVENRGVADAQPHALLRERSKSGQLGLDRVGADRQRRHDIRAGFGGHGRTARACFHVCRRDGGARQRAAALVDDRAAQLRLRHLGARRSRTQGDCHKHCQQHLNVTVHEHPPE